MVGGHEHFTAAHSQKLACYLCHLGDGIIASSEDLAFGVAGITTLVNSIVVDHHKWSTLNRGKPFLEDFRRLNEYRPGNHRLNDLLTVCKTVRGIAALQHVGSDRINRHGTSWEQCRHAQLGVTGQHAGHSCATRAHTGTAQGQGPTGDTRRQIGAHLIAHRVRNDDSESPAIFGPRALLLDLLAKESRLRGNGRRRIGPFIHEMRLPTIGEIHKKLAIGIVNFGRELRCPPLELCGCLTHGRHEPTIFLVDTVPVGTVGIEYSRLRCHRAAVHIVRAYLLEHRDRCQ